MSNYILAVDQSIACTGWTIFWKGDMIASGCIKTKKDMGNLHARCSMITTGLLEALTDYDWIDVMFCREGLGFGASNSNASRDLAYLVGFIENEFGQPFKEVPPTSLKKFATGTGKAKKEDMIAALPAEVREEFMSKGFKKSTGLADLADAYFIGRYFYGQS